MESNKKLLSIISFSLVAICLLTAIITDIVIFSDVLKTFLGAIIISVIAFVFMMVGFIVSIVLIFGVYIIQEHGFWPLHLAFSLFKEILQDIQISPSQIETFRTFRFIFIAVCVVALILAIIAMHKDEMIPGPVPLRGLSKFTMVLAIMGIVVALGMLVVTSLV